MRISSAVLVVSITTLAFAAGVSAGSYPPTSAYMQPYPKPVPDAAAEAFIDRVVPSLRRYTAEDLAQGIVVVPARASRSEPKVDDGQVAVRPAQRDSISGGRTAKTAAVASTELLERAGVGTTGGGLDARWISLLAVALAVAGFAARFIVERRPTSSLTE